MERPADALAQAYRELMADYRAKEAGEQTAADALCGVCPHRLRFHEGRKRDCVMAGCHCRGFIEHAAV